MSIYKDETSISVVLSVRSLDWNGDRICGRTFEYEQ